MKLNGPLFSLKASGNLANALTYSKRKTHNHGRYKQQENKIITAAQAEKRNLTELCTLTWRNLSDATKEEYKTMATEYSPRLTGFQYFCRVNMLNPKTHLNTVIFYLTMYLQDSAYFNNLSRTRTLATAEAKFLYKKQKLHEKYR